MMQLSILNFQVNMMAAMAAISGQILLIMGLNFSMVKFCRTRFQKNQIMLIT